MRKIIFASIAFLVFGISTTQAQDCFIEYDSENRDTSFLVTTETSRTFKAARQLTSIIRNSDTAAACADDCCMGGSWGSDIEGNVACLWCSNSCLDGTWDYYMATCYDIDCYYYWDRYGTWDVICEDADLDGIPDDGDNSGVVGDNPCTGGNTLNCDDNCRLVANATQVDGDGDSIGDACININIWYSSHTIKTAEDIAALAGYTEVVGNLVIENSNLTSLSGLEALVRVGGGLSIVSNTVMSSLSGLENLTSVGNLYVQSNAALSNLRGLKNLNSVEKSITITYNSELSNLDGLYYVNLMGDYLNIFSNTNLCTNTAHTFLARMRANGYTGSTRIYDNNGTICPPEIANITTNQGPEGTYIPLVSGITFSLDTELIQWVPSDPDAEPEPGEEWSWSLGIAHSYVSYWTFGMSEYSPEIELTLNNDVTGFFARWKWFSPAAYLPNDGMYWIKLIAEDMNGNRSEAIHSIRVDTADSDMDSIPDVIDNCPSICNSGQIDADGDGIGDVCDSDPGCDGCGAGPICEIEC
jgi:hypothetical protein